MLISKCIADHARENMDQSTLAFKSIYALACGVRVIEVLSIVGLFWFFAVVIALL